MLDLLVVATLIAGSARPVPAATHATAAAASQVKPPAPPTGWYASWGYNTAQYAPVDIHFVQSGLGNDFLFSSARMHDSKAWDIWNHPPTVPQYSLRVGKFIKPDWAIELNFDHAKAILTQEQNVDVSGTIDGATVSGSVPVSSLVQEYQLNNGANFVLINVVRRYNLYGRLDRTGNVSVLLKAGAGITVPHTQNIVLGQPNEKGFQFGGFGAGIEGVIRGHVYRTIYAEFSQKGFYGQYRNVNIHAGKAHQHLWAYVTVLQFGTTFNFHDLK
ncbi:MAG TPA: hypothetical protein VFV78_14785 [Vicinamibacterales bacterium]|nr:hypothetical protein [Vicinamibacterales bacterium]